MGDPATSTITCTTCGLQVAFRPNSNGLYTVEFDSAQFVATCKMPIRSRSFQCIELDLAIMIANSPLAGAAKPGVPDQAGEPAPLVDRE
jgi:hypothetical protein